MKPFIYSICCSVMLSPLFANVSHSSAASPTQAVVTVNTLNMRSNPSTQGSILGKLYKNNKIVIMEEKNGWSKITYQNKQGWVSSSYIQKDSTEKSSNTSISTQTLRPNAIVNANKLNVRSLPSTNGKIITSLSKNTKVTVLTTKESWTQIQTSSKQIGWVANQYLTESKSNSKTVEDSLKPSTASNQNPSKSGVVNASSLNVRTLPSTTGKVIASLPKNTIVSILSVDGKWTQIKTSSNQVGWVSSQYLVIKTTNVIPGNKNPQKQNESKSNVAPPSSLVTLKSNANFRRGPGTNFTVIGSGKAGTTYRLIGEEKGWVKVKVNNNQDAWVAGWLVSKGSSILSSPTSKPSTSSPMLKGKTIVIDAGHGGKDPGAVGNGMFEKDIALEVAQRVERRLKANGATIIMTRAGDSYPSLGDRVDIANNHQADIFVSVHVNSASSSAKGTETFYDSSTNPQSAEGKKLATEIQSQIISLLGTKDRGVKNQGFQVIKHTEMPSVLVELGFITNSEDAKKLSSQRDLFAQAIYNGIITYYNKK